MNYPLGSFPRYGHQERWAQERRQRAIANSIATRRARKYDRAIREGCELLALHGLVGWINLQLKGRDMPDDYASLAKSIGGRVTRMIETFEIEKYYRGRASLQ